jgi:hypothetical protein
MIWLSCVIVLLCVTIAFLVTEIGHRGILIERLEFEVRQLESTLLIEERRKNDTVHSIKGLQKLLNDTARRLDMRWQNSILKWGNCSGFLVKGPTELESLESDLTDFCQELLTDPYGRNKGLNA